MGMRHSREAFSAALEAVLENGLPGKGVASYFSVFYYWDLGIMGIVIVGVHYKFNPTILANGANCFPVAFILVLETLLISVYSLIISACMVRYTVYIKICICQFETHVVSSSTRRRTDTNDQTS